MSCISVLLDPIYLRPRIQFQGGLKQELFFKIGQNRLSKEFSPLQKSFYFAQLPACSSLPLLFMLKKHMKLAVIFFAFNNFGILVCCNSFICYVYASLQLNYAKCCFMLFSGLTYLALVGTGNYSSHKSDLLNNKIHF